MDISIIIPTHNRKNVLKRCILALTAQTYPRSEYEIIIVDDGSKDGTGELVQSLQGNPDCMLRLLAQENRGPASARNLGIQHAIGDILLFLGDDIISTADLISRHSKLHERYPDDHVAVLGHVTWSPEIRINPLMRWLESSGVQFGYGTIKNPENVPFNYFYTANVSVKKRFLLKNGLFDEDFPYAAWEDIELAFRLSYEGLRIVYDPKALAYHEHEVNQETIAKRSRLAGRAMALFHQKHPEAKGVLSPVGRRRFRILRKLPLWFPPSSLAKWVPQKSLYAYYNCMITKEMETGYRDQKNAGLGTESAKV